MNSTQEARVQKTHIGINAHLLAVEAGYRRAGIHHYIFQVLRHLPAAESTRYTIYTRLTDEWDGRPDLHPAGTRIPTTSRLARIAWEQVVWPIQARRDGLTLMHSMAFAMPRLAPCPVVVTIYDLSFIENPESFPTAQRRYLMSETGYSCRHAVRLIAISESGRRDIQRHFGVPPERIDVVTPGVGSIYRPLPIDQVEQFRRNHDLPERFILHVGTLQPRKNIPFLLEAVARLGRTNVPLVLVGGRGWYYETIFEQVKALGIADRVRFAGYVDDDDLPLWYNAATVLAFPSLYEGFGLPVAEALACGTAVVAADSSSIPEAGGDVAQYFTPGDVAGLTARLALVLDTPALLAQAQAAGPRHVARFSWSRAGEETAEVYRRAMVESACSEIR